MLDNLQLLFVYAPVMNVQMILDGIFIGAVFALAAYGLALVWGVMNVKNLAQGDFVIMGGYLAFTANNLGFHPILALPVIAVIMYVYGVVVYKLVIRRVIDNDMFVSLLATFGLSLFMQQVMNLIYGPEVQTVDSHMHIMTMFDDFVTVPLVKIVSLLLAGCFAAAIVIFMTKSRTGQAIRATAQDARAARVLGIDTDKVYMLTFAFNLPGVIGMSFVLGWVEQYAGIIAGAEWQVASAVFVLISVLLWRQIQLRRQRQVVR